MCVGLYMGFPGGAVVKNPPAKQDTPVRSLGREDPLEEGMATHPILLPGGILWIEEPGRLQFIGLQRVRHNWSALACTHMYETFSCVSSDRLCLSRNVSTLSELQNAGHKIACSVLCCPFNVCRGCSEAPSSVPGIGHLCLLSLFLLVSLSDWRFVTYA